jgi:predicted transcriptional regulator of viral defense system
MVERLSLHFPLMSTAQAVREIVEGAPARSFFEPSDFEGTTRAIECELSRLAAHGELARTRKGLYWKGPKTRVGMPLPRPAEIALKVAGPGGGLAETSAVHALGLTTQVPSVDVVAVPGRAPKQIAGTRFVSRSIERRIHGLTPLEIAVVEVLRIGPTEVEAPWSTVETLIRTLISDQKVRLETIASQVTSIIQERGNVGMTCPYRSAHNTVSSVHP